MKEVIIHKEVWVPSLNAFTFKESIDPKTGERKFIMKGLMLPFETVSRNAVLYNTDSIKAKHKGLIGKPVMYNHKVDSDMLPKGHFTNSWIENDGWYYEADIDPAEKELIRKLERQDLRHVSIQLIGGKVQEKMNESNQTYTEAWVEDIIEGSIVPAPGFLDTTASFAEALNVKKEDLTTDSGAGASKTRLVGEDDDTRETNLIVESDGDLISKVKDYLKTNPKPSDEEFHGWAEKNGIVVAEAEMAAYELAGISSTLKHAEDPDEDFDKTELEAGIRIELEHTDDEAIAKAIAKAHLAEIPDYYTRLSQMENDAIKSGIESLSDTELKETVQNLKEFSLTTGEIVRIPFGVDGVSVDYQGQLGKIVKVGSDSYTVEVENGKKLKIDKEVFDISVVS